MDKTKPKNRGCVSMSTNGSRNKLITVKTTDKPISRKGEQLKFKSETLRSYVECLELFHFTNFRGSFNFIFENQLQHFGKVFKPFPIGQWPKVFKGMLADFFSRKNNQERPKVLVDGKYLFYSSLKGKISRALTSSTKFRVKATWDLMQCKTLAKESHADFIKESLIQHSKVVSSLTSVSADTLTEFKKFIQPYIIELASQLNDNYTCRLPTNHSSYENKRSEGGVSASYKIHSSGVIQPSNPRLDPITVIISGKPGCGKSILQSRIVKEFEKIFSSPSVHYARNSQTKHWDGYQNQPIVLIDDFLQQKAKQAQEDVSHCEFITLTSSVDYVLPMAELKDKGKKFNSPIIIYSTNSSSPSNFIDHICKTQSEPMAVARRINYWLDVDMAGKCRLFKGIKTSLERHTPDRLLSSFSIHDSSMLTTVLMSDWFRKSTVYSQLFEDTPLIPLTGSEQYIEAPEVSHNKVKVVPLLEPLKVRIITIGTSSNFVLKGLQESMLNSLRKFPEFLPCFTPDYAEKLKRLYNREEFWLSGDYTAATDGLHSQMMSTVIDEIMPLVPEWVKPYLRRESGIHTCEYPKQYEIPDAYQTNGQLMGSLLSFPILSLANAFTLYKSTNLPLGELPGLIHGDDILARLSSVEIEKWKQFCPEIGFGLSMGKNYISPVWGSIDSQVFYGPDAEHLRTGKYKGFRLKTIDIIPTLLSKGIEAKHIVSYINKRSSILINTPRSIDVSQQYGGLHPCLDRKPYDDTSRALYSQKLSKLFKVEKTLLGYEYSVDKSTLNSKTMNCYAYQKDETKSSRDEFRYLKSLKKRKLVCKPNLEAPIPEVVAVFRTEVDQVLHNTTRNCREMFEMACPVFDF